MRVEGIQVQGASMGVRGAACSPTGGVGGWLEAWCPGIVGVDS